jgi:hypothetical protein
MTCNESGCADPVDAVWRPRLTAVWHNATNATGTGAKGTASASSVCRVVTRVEFEPALCAKYGAPTAAFVEYTVAADGGQVAAKLTWW